MARPQEPAANKPQGNKDPWNDTLPDSLPKKAQYFDALRTDGYTNHNLVSNYLEWWVAFKVDSKRDNWRVMHYMVSGLSELDGNFTAERATASEEVSFIEALACPARAEYRMSNMPTHKAVDVAQEYPAEAYPELCPHFHEVDHFRPAANIEGVVFDEFNDPYRRIEGKIFSDATFKRSEVVKSIRLIEKVNTKAVNRMEAGVLSDIFNEPSQRSATLDNILKIGQVLSEMDQFATRVGEFYLGVRKALSLPMNLDGVVGLPEADRKRLQADAQKGVTSPKDEILEYLTDYTLPSAEAHLDLIAQLGVHTEPFRKFIAECEVYTHMLNATQKLPQLEKGLYSASTTDISLVTEIKESVQAARKRFLQLGGTVEQMDKINAWIANPDKEMIPGWIPGFISRYYESRGNVMQKVQERKAGPKQVNLMPADVKPPLQEEAQQGEQAEAAQPAAEKLDIDKYRNVMDGGKGPKI